MTPKILRASIRQRLRLRLLSLSRTQVLGAVRRRQTRLGKRLAIVSLRLLFSRQLYFSRFATVRGIGSRLTSMIVRYVYRDLTSYRHKSSRCQFLATAEFHSCARSCRCIGVRYRLLENHGEYRQKSWLHETGSDRMVE